MILRAQNRLRKLNLGCGLDYRPGYLNVDFHNTLVADLIVSADSLEFPEGHFEEILLNDVLEHFGYCSSYFILADLHRFLAKDGVLIVSTPDIERSVRQYIEAQGKPDDKESILCWIYGVEDEGMAHKFCFPKEFLAAFLRKSGFSIVECEETGREEFRPSIEVRAGKAEETRYTLRNEVLSMIKKSGALTIRYADFPFFEKSIEAFVDAKDENDLASVFEDLSVLSPKLGLLLLEYETGRGSIRGSKRFLEGRLEFFTRLARINIFNLLRDAPLEYEGARNFLVSILPETADIPAGEDTGFACDFFTEQSHASFHAFLEARAKKARF